MLHRYADPPRDFSWDEVTQLARGCTSAIAPVVSDGKSLSAAELFALVTTAAAAYVRAWQVPGWTPWRYLDGPARAYVRIERRGTGRFLDSRGTRSRARSRPSSRSSASPAASLPRSGWAREASRRPTSSRPRRPSSRRCRQTGTRARCRHAAHRPRDRRGARGQGLARPLGLGHLPRGLPRADDHGAREAAGVDAEACAARVVDGQAPSPQPFSLLSPQPQASVPDPWPSLPSDMTSPKARIAPIDVLRGLTILSVVAYHFHADTAGVVGRALGCRGAQRVLVRSLHGGARTDRQDDRRPARVQARPAALRDRPRAVARRTGRRVRVPAPARPGRCCRTTCSGASAPCSC